MRNLFLLALSLAATACIVDEPGAGPPADQVDPPDAMVADGDAIDGQASVDAAAPSAAVKLLEGIEAPADLLIGNGNAYWLEAPGMPPMAGSVRFCATTGCGGLPTILRNKINGPHKLAIGPSRVFWSSSSGIDSCPVEGCGANTGISMGSLLNFVDDVHVDAQSLFWVDSTTDTIRSCPTTGCPSSAQLVDYKPEYVSPNFALRGNEIFWTEFSRGEVRSCPKTGCSTPKVLASLQDRPGSIVTDDARVYFASNASNGAIFSIPIGGGSRTLVTKAVLPGSLVVHGPDLYWRASDGVYRCTVASCNPMRVLDDAAILFALDDVAIYWIDRKGMLWRRAF